MRVASLGWVDMNSGVPDGLGHVVDAEVIGLGLVVATERQQDAVLRSESERSAERRLVLRAREGRGEVRDALGHEHLAQALPRMARHHVRYLVAKDDGQSRLALGDGQDARVNDDRPVGGGVGVHVLGSHDGHLPLSLLGQAGGLYDAAGHALDHRQVLAAIGVLRLDERVLALGLLEELGTTLTGELGHLRIGDEEQLRAPRERHLRARAGSQGDHEENGAESYASTLRPSESAYASSSRCISRMAASAARRSSGVRRCRRIVFFVSPDSSFSIASWTV
jgi:hypothetical protein